ncbi:Uncharacterised protein [Mycobacteroides abscessus subsp. abscessus]|nr:Uncharacterised protein [Mycobacteroides abscessus subsp. abscessus]
MAPSARSAAPSAGSALPPAASVVPVTTASNRRWKFLSRLVCTVTDAPPGCGLSVVVNVPVFGNSPWVAAAPTRASSNTSAAAARTNSRGSVTAAALTSHA